MPSTWPPAGDVTTTAGGATIVVQGSSLVVALARLQADGVTPSAAYLSTDVLSCRLWSGADQAVLEAPSAYWLSAPAGTFAVAFAPSDTASLDPDVYRLQVVAARGGVPLVIFDGRAEVTAAPGSAPVPPVYISYQDMRTVMPDIVNLLGERDETGFLAERADARNWLDEAVHRHNDGTANLQSDLGALAYAYRWPGKSPTMIGWLASDYLVMSQPLVKAQCYYALSQIFAGRVLSNPKLYSMMAALYETKASNQLRLATAQVMSGGTKRWYAGGGCYDGTLLTILDFSATIRLRG